MKLSAAFEASIALSFGDVSDAYQFFPSTLGISDNPDYRANLQHCRITDIDYKRNHAGVSDHVRAALRKAILAIWCVAFCGLQWRAIGQLCDIPFGTLYTLFAPGSGCGAACSIA